MSLAFIKEFKIRIKFTSYLDLEFLRDGPKQTFGCERWREAPVTVTNRTVRKMNLFWDLEQRIIKLNKDVKKADNVANSH